MKKKRFTLSCIAAILLCGIFGINSAAAITDYQLTAKTTQEGEDISTLDVYKDMPTDIYYNLKGLSEATEISDARLNIDVTKPSTGAIVSLMATDSLGNSIDVMQTGYWGPAEGFSIGPETDDTTIFTGTFDTEGQYTITVNLMQLSTASLLESKVLTVNVLSLPDETAEAPAETPVETLELTESPAVTEFTTEPVVPTDEVSGLTEIIIKPSFKTIKVGEKLNLTAVPVPETAELPELKWEASNDDIAAVDETGKVTALKAGRVVITASTEDGSVVGVSNITVVNPSPKTGDGDSTLYIILGLIMLFLSGSLMVLIKKGKKAEEQ